MVSERVILLGQNLYETIPNEIVISSIPTASELEYVGAEDFDRTILEKILPEVVENSQDMNFNELLDIDYDWVCRCLRMQSYGPYFSINRIYCPSCNQISEGEYTADLRTVDIIPLPPDFVNKITIDPDEFIDFDESITLHLLTAGEELTMQSDHAFDRPDGSRDMVLARLCYMITNIGGRVNPATNQLEVFTPLDIRAKIKKSFSPADYELLKDKIREVTNYGLRTTGAITCPKCGSKEAYFIAFQSDKFFRPSVGDIKEWKRAKRSGDWDGLCGDPKEYIRVDSE